MIVVDRLKRSVLCAVVAGALMVVLGIPTTAYGEGLSPWWSLTVSSRPTSLPAGGAGQIVLSAENMGDTNTSGKVTITDKLPDGLEAIGIKGIAGLGARDR